nr:glycosyltransferase family 4 protein [Nocardioides sp.]
ADRVLVNSEASLGALRESLPWAARRASVVYNGVPGPPEVAGLDAVPSGPARIAMVGRLSPRKGTDVALEATALLVARGYDVLLEVAGSVFPGYEWFEEELRRRADQPDLAGRVVLHGYLNPVWSLLARCRVVLVPSRTEPFGNAAVEAQLAGRPVVVAGVQGLREIVTDGENGLVVPSEDAAALADAIARLLDDEALAQRLARSGRESAERRFGPATYRDHIASEVRTLVG